ncbi:MAG: metal ABC transporter permease [Kofleriaceae bacterium]|nr:MAG: metal ABC transporter permease [Kofleriaceae bacterium]MBZ0231321.1 metal ABC transporter permease [Kofleriaceae bacterium]
MDERLVLGLIAGSFIGGAAGYLGSLMLGRRMALVAGPLGHLTLPGVALALVWDLDVSVGAFPFVLLGVALIWLLELRTRLPMEALTALVFASGVAFAFLFLPVEQAEAALVGDISRPGVGGTLFAVAASLAVTVAVNRAYRQLVLISISEDLAASEGVRVRRYNLLYLLAIAIIVALGVKMVGGLLTAALVAIPALAARNISRNLWQYAAGATAIGIASALGGIALYRLTGYPAGPLVILVSAVIFVATVPLARSRR